MEKGKEIKRDKKDQSSFDLKGEKTIYIRSIASRRFKDSLVGRGFCMGIDTDMQNPCLFHSF